MLRRLLGQESSDHSQVSDVRTLTVAGILDKYGIIIALILMMMLLTILQPEYFLTVGNLTNVSRQVTSNALLSLGQFLVILTAGIDLSVGSVMAFCMVVLAILVNEGWNPWLVMAVTIGIGLFAGLLNGWSLTRGWWAISLYVGIGLAVLLSSFLGFGGLVSILAGLVMAAVLIWLSGRLKLPELRSPHPFIGTLAMLNIARGATNLVTGGVPVSNTPTEVRLFGAGSIRIYELADGTWIKIPIALVVVILLYFWAWVFLTKTRTGRHIYAVGGSPQASLYAGVNVDLILTLVYILCGGFAGVAGIMLAGRTNSGYPNAGLQSELDAIAAVIIGGASFFGGRGTVVGTFVGVLIMGFMRNGLNLMDVSVFWQQVLIGVVIMVAVYVDMLRRRTPD